MSHKAQSNAAAEEISTPFLKWPGGKRWFVANYADLLPLKFERYIEPFLGSAAVFFLLKPRRAILGDLNADLITTYRGIRENWEGVEVLLHEHSQRHSKSYYYFIRDLIPATTTEAAARFIYLNRTCFNGIYRVNLAGKFNVPKGSKDSVLLAGDIM